jgi:NAD-dependent deacetylase
MDAPERERLVGLLGAARRILAFTGAGVSTGSGIPDFRGPQGVWTRFQPVYFQDFLASEASRVEYWRQKALAWESFRDARPNAAHEALVTLERSGRIGALVTQNIDGLHQLAGTAAELLLEVHGTNRLVECLGCGRRTDPGPAVAAFRADPEHAPECSDCGRWLKFATISFGQALDPRVLAAAERAAAEADLVLALGSTLSVYPAAAIPLSAARRGIPYVIVNRGPTEHDELAALRLEGDVVELLPAAVAALPSP